jgi:hypothetical protein
VCGRNGEVCWGVAGHDNGGGKPFEHVGDALQVGGPYPYCVAAVMPEGCTQIQSFRCVMCSCAPDDGHIVDENLGARWSKGLAVVVKRSIVMGLSGELWIYA